MPKPPGTLGAETQTKNLNPIVLRISAQFNYLQKTSVLSVQPDGTQPEESPVLPEHLDKLLDLPWTLEASRQIDLWLWYTQQEFETDGGAV